MNLNILLFTSCRSDFGKLLKLGKLLRDKSNLTVFATGQHLRKELGYTYRHIEKEGFSGIHLASCGNTYTDRGSDVSREMSRYLRDNPTDLVIIHGDRLEALGAAMAASSSGVSIAHVEGGEISGSLDGVFRHSISKLSDYHFVANQEAEKVLHSIGEFENIFVTGSPETDIILSANRPSLQETFSRYNIPDTHRAGYGIVLLHPVTPQTNSLPLAEAVRDALLSLGLAGIGPWVFIHPNDEPGREAILDTLSSLTFLSVPSQQRAYPLPSMRLEHFLTLLEHAHIILGNSSAGVREAIYYGTPAVDVGYRQHGRNPKVKSVGESVEEIRQAVLGLWSKRFPAECVNGDGNSSVRIAEIILEKETAALVEVLD